MCFRGLHVITFVTVLFGFSATLYARKVTVSGFVKDAETGESLLYANCMDTLSKTGVSANADGYFSITLPRGRVCIRTSYLGYETGLSEWRLTGDTAVIITLKPGTSELEEVVVNAHVPVKEQVWMGKTNIPVKTIKAIPSFLGEPDVLKAISFIPGVSTGKDGYSNIYVRGGDRGQNLILLDGMRLYNTGHAGGFVSLFNSDVIKHVDVYKGGFPARYGGRASSVIDIYTKDGSDERKIGGKLNLGLLNSGVLLEGSPLQNFNYFLALRTTWYDLFTIPARRQYKQTGIGGYNGYTFFDINGKLSWRASPKTKLSLCVFTGQDHQKTEEAMEGSYQNMRTSDRMDILCNGISLTATRVISPKLFLTGSAGYSVYRNSSASRDSRMEYGSTVTENTTVSSRIYDISWHSRLEWAANNRNRIKTGFEVVGGRFVPGVQTAFYENVNAESKLDTVYGMKSDAHSYEVSIYAEDDISLSDRIKINAGVRAASYFCGNADFYRIEPRISARWLFGNNWAIKMNYTVMNQFHHTVVNNVNGFEKEIWVAAGNRLKPQQAQQSSFGLFYGNSERKTDISIEVFYKDMRHLIDFKTPVHHIDNWTDIESRMAINGKGKSYGMEFQYTKELKNFNTSVSYTLSRNIRQFDELNNGQWFPFIYDRTHDLSVLALWKISEKYSLNGNFTLSTGMPCTLPVAYSSSDPLFYQYYVYGSINNRRLPMYHRLDLALTRRVRMKNGGIRQFYINIFNVYARQNPVSVYYNSNTGKVYQKAIFSIIPTIGYMFEF